MDLPDILRQALQATRKDIESQRQFQIVRASQVTSFPLTDCNELDDDDEEEGDVEHAEFIMVCGRGMQ